MQKQATFSNYPWLPLKEYQTCSLSLALAKPAKGLLARFIYQWAAFQEDEQLKRICLLSHQYRLTAYFEKEEQRKENTHP